MIEHVETPLIQRFRGKTAELKAAAAAIGGEEQTGDRESSGLNFYFQPLPRVPVTLMKHDLYAQGTLRCAQSDRRS